MDNYNGNYNAGNGNGGENSGYSNVGNNNYGNSYGSYNNGGSNYNPDFGYSYNNNYNYNYGYGFYTTDPAFQLRRSSEKQLLRFYSTCAGCALIAFVFLQNLLSYIFYFAGLSELYYNDSLFQNSIGIFTSFLCILMPFIIIHRIEKKRTPQVECFPLSKPKKTSLIFLSVPVGLALCIIGSYASSLLASYIEALGFKLTSQPISAPSDTFGTVIYFIRVSLCAAIVEEITMRGIVMQPLRKFGSRFAILSTALVFGIMHCNLIQAPFAFLAGIALGYFAIATESLWAPLIIHLLNNLFSLIVDTASRSMSEEGLTKFYYTCIICIIAAAVICLPFFYKIRGSFALPRGETVLTRKEKTAAFLFTVPMIIAILLMLWITSGYVTFGG